MAKRRPGRAAHDSDTGNGQVNHFPKPKDKGKSPGTTQWVTPAALFKAAVLVVIAAVGPIIILRDFSFKGPDYFTSSSSSSSAQASKNNGGWKPADAKTVARFDSDFCNIERLSVADLDPVRFEKEFRYKKPVIVTFPNGASDWTEPNRWTLEELKRSYGNWQISSGNSVEIVRRGGNGDVTSSFLEFTDRLMDESATVGQPMYYMFDRTFYKDSDLPSTFKLPPYFSNDDTDNDSIFFLGASGSGVVFHKHADTWNAVVYGRKRWFLYPMTKTPPGGVYHGFTILDWYERVYPNLSSERRPLECIQQGGEILYLHGAFHVVAVCHYGEFFTFQPEGYYHATLNIGDTVAVAQQKKQAVLVSEKIFYEVTELNNQLANPDTKNKEEIHQKLLNDFLKLRELMPESAEVNMKLGEKYGDMGQHNRAIECLQKAIDLDPYFVLAFTTLGINLVKLKRYEEAEAALTHAISLSPTMWDVYKEYGIFLVQRARYADSVPVLKKGAELNPGLLPFWSYLKLAQELSGDSEGAKQTQVKIDEMRQKTEN